MEVKSPASGEETPRAPAGWSHRLGSSLAEKDLRILEHGKANKIQPCVLAAKAANSVLGGSRRNSTRRMRSCPARGTHISSAGPGLRKRVQGHGRGGVSPVKMIKGLEHLVPKERLRELKLLRERKRRLTGNLLSVHKYFMRESKTTDSSLYCPVVEQDAKGTN